jgi:hypothetical protein
MLASSESEEYRPLPEGFMPTGYADCPDGRLILGRLGKDARLYLYSDEGRLTYITLYDEEELTLGGRLGGLTVIDKYIYVGCDGDILVYYYEDIECFDERVICYDRIKAFTVATSLSVSGDFLYVGGYHPADGCEGCGAHLTSPAGDESTSLITSFRLTTERGKGAVRYIIPTPVCAISVGSSLRGIAVDGADVYISRSDGELLSSLEHHTLDTSRRSTVTFTDGERQYRIPLVFLDSSTEVKKINMPPMQRDVYISRKNSIFSPRVRLLAAHIRASSRVRKSIRLTFWRFGSSTACLQNLGAK